LSGRSNFRRLGHLGDWVLLEGRLSRETALALLAAVQRQDAHDTVRISAAPVTPRVRAGTVAIAGSVVTEASNIAKRIGPVAVPVVLPGGSRTATLVLDGVEELVVVNVVRALVRKDGFFGHSSITGSLVVAKRPPSVLAVALLVVRGLRIPGSDVDAGQHELLLLVATHTTAAMPNCALDLPIP